MQPSIEGKPEERKAYRKPAIIRELELETRAGTPETVPDLLDPLGGL